MSPGRAIGKTSVAWAALAICFPASFAPQARTQTLPPESQSPRLTSLDYDNPDPRLHQLKSEIFEHLRISRSGRELHKLRELRFYTYTVSKDENFFTIVARTGQNPDTLANVNNLASVYDVYPGQKLKIPNYRGVFVRTKKGQTVEQVSQAYKIRLDVLRKMNIAHPNETNRILFLPGVRFSAQERRYFSGKEFIHPLPVARISSRYGYRKSPFTRRRTFHSGVDLAAPTGTAVRATSRGKVVFAGWKGGYGKLVILRHKLGYHTWYGHLSKISVRSGQSVKQGQIIGKVGSTGRSTGPHLHFELRRLGRSESPHRIVGHR